MRGGVWAGHEFGVAMGRRLGENVREDGGLGRRRKAWIVLHCTRRSDVDASPIRRIAPSSAQANEAN